MKASPAVLYAVSPRKEAEPVAHCGIFEEPTTLALTTEAWASLEGGIAVENPGGTLMPLVDAGRLSGILALGQGPPLPESQHVWQICKDFLCSRLRSALQPTEERAPPNTKAVWGGRENGLSVTGGLVFCDSLAAQMRREGRPTVPEILRNQTLAALRKLLGPRDAVGVLPSGDVWFLVLTATPPDPDLLALTVAESLAEKLSTLRTTINPMIRLIPHCNGAEELFQP